MKPVTRSFSPNSRREPKNLHELKPGTKITKKMVFNWVSAQWGKHFTAIKMNAMMKEGKSLLEMWVWFNQYYIHIGYNAVICTRKHLEDLYDVLEVEDE